jgi:hypothetical protein
MNSHYPRHVSLVSEEVTRWEAHDRVKAGKGSADGEAAEARLGDRAVYDSLLAKAIEQALCDFVSVDAGMSALSSCAHVCYAFPNELVGRRGLSLSPKLLNDALGRVVCTYAPLYCATSSPSTKTLSFCSISSAMASFKASRTVISLAPLDAA